MTKSNFACRHTIFALFDIRDLIIALSAVNTACLEVDTSGLAALFALYRCEVGDDFVFGARIDEAVRCVIHVLEDQRALY